MIKILATIGPSSDAKPIIEGFSGHDVLFRLNGSHGNLAWHQQAIQNIRAQVEEAFILLDVPGVKPRTANEQALDIKKGQHVFFGGGAAAKDMLHVQLTRPLPMIDPSEKCFSVNDGQYVFDILDFGEQFLVGQSRVDFTLLSRKGLNVPNSIYDEKKQLRIYEEFITQVVDLDIDGLGLSFVQTGELVEKVRSLLPKAVLVSKIENTEGLKNCEKIIEKSDAIMIDRGDLAAEIGLTGLYDAVLEISAFTKGAGKPLIMATENLESMITREVPSKSEVMSIAHSVEIGADCIMLSEETAVAKNGLMIVSWLAEYLEKLTPPARVHHVPSERKKYPEIWQLVKYLGECPVLLMSKSGYALFDFIAAKPDGEITVVTNNLKVKAVTKLFSRNICVLPAEAKQNTPIETIWEVVAKNKVTLFGPHDKIAALFVSKYVRESRANCITFFHKNDFT